MAAFGRRRGVPAEVATFEEWDSAGRHFDTVVAGQAWHWVDPVAGAAKAAQVLRPGGLLAVFWNVFAPPRELAAAFGEVYARVVPEMPHLGATPPMEPYLRMAAAVADGMRGRFAPPEEWRYGWEHSYTRDEWLDQVPTFGGHSLLAVEQLGPLLAGIGAAIDAVGGRFAMCYTTLVVAAVRS
jgi:SAM-dependent methyltransferase